jgi:hypothetical protein
MFLVILFLDFERRGSRKDYAAPFAVKTKDYSSVLLSVPRT